MLIPLSQGTKVNVSNRSVSDRVAIFLHRCFSYFLSLLLLSLFVLLFFTNTGVQVFLLCCYVVSVVFWVFTTTVKSSSLVKQVNKVYIIRSN